MLLIFDLSDNVLFLRNIRRLDHLLRILLMNKCILVHCIVYVSCLIRYLCHCLRLGLMILTRKRRMLVEGVGVDHEALSLGALDQVGVLVLIKRLARLLDIRCLFDFGSGADSVCSVLLSGLLWWLSWNWMHLIQWILIVIELFAKVPVINIKYRFQNCILMMT